MSGYDWLSAIGIVLNAGGIALAVIAIYDETTKKDLQPAWRKWLRNRSLWVERVILRRTRPATVRAGTATGTFGFSATITASRRVRTGDPIEDRLLAVETSIAELAQTHRAENEAVKARLAEISSTVGKDIDTIRQAMREAEQRSLIIEGSAKNLEMFGLLLVAAGAACQVVALVLG